MERRVLAIYFFFDWHNQKTRDKKNRRVSFPRWELHVAHSKGFSRSASFLFGECKGRLPFVTTNRIFLSGPEKKCHKKQERRKKSDKNHFLNTFHHKKYIYPPVKKNLRGATEFWKKTLERRKDKVFKKYVCVQDACMGHITSAFSAG